MTENTITPQAESHEELLLRLLNESQIRVTESYELQPIVIKVGDAILGTLGNFSASIGKAKSKKTFNVTALVAAALSGQSVLRYDVTLPADKQKILYVDTEQSSFHCKKAMRRIHHMAGLPEDEECDRLIFLGLRKYRPDTRVELIETAMRINENLGLVIIDGIRDLVVDINSPSEATYITSKLMQWTDEKQVHIHVVLHQNKGDDNARGHIGTEVNNKAETVLQVEKDKTDPCISKVESVLIRDKDFEPFAFRINDDILPELVNDYSFEKVVGRPKKSDEEKDPFMAIPIAKHQEIVENACNGLFIEYSYAELQKTLKEAYAQNGFSMGDNKIVKIITSLTNKRIFVKNEKGKNVLNEYRHW